MARVAGPNERVKGAEVDDDHRNSVCMVIVEELKCSLQCGKLHKLKDLFVSACLENP